MTATKLVDFGRGYDPRLHGGTPVAIKAVDYEKAARHFDGAPRANRDAFRPTIGVIISDLSEPPKHSSTRGAYQVHKVRVYDPRRTGVAPLLVHGEVVNLVRGDAYHESEEFVVIESGDEINWKARSR